MPDGASRSLKLSDIQRAIGGEIIGEAGVCISGVSSLEEAGEEDISYVTGDRYVPVALRSRAAAFLVSRPIKELDRPQLVVPNPAYALICVIQHFFPTPPKPRGIAAQVVQGSGVQIGPDASIGPFVTLGNRVTLGARVTLHAGVFIGDDAVVGDDCILYPHVTVMDRCVIGNRVIIHAGTVIGSDGFGYVQHDGRHHKVPQLGTVVIEDDVELGANVTVDRATFGRTVIKRGTKIDNLVQIAHNVTIGEDSVLVAQVGIAGSSTLGRHVMVGGQAGVADHLTIGDGALIAARSGISRSVEPGEIVSGNPAIPHAVSLRAHALIPHLPEFRQQLRQVVQRITALEQQLKRTKAKRKSKKRS